MSTRSPLSKQIIYPSSLWHSNMPRLSPRLPALVREEDSCGVGKGPRFAFVLYHLKHFSAKRLLARCERAEH